MTEIDISARIEASDDMTTEDLIAALNAIQEGIRRGDIKLMPSARETYGLCSGLIVIALRRGDNARRKEAVEHINQVNALIVSDDSPDVPEHWKAYKHH